MKFQRASNAQTIEITPEEEIRSGGEARIYAVGPQSEAEETLDSLFADKRNESPNALLAKTRSESPNSLLAKTRNESPNSLLANLVAKIYRHPREETARKLAVMLANPPIDPTAAQGHASIAWPVDLLRSVEDKKRVLGYLMPLAVGTHPIIDFYNPASRRETCPLFSYKYLYRTARNLAAVVHALHGRDYVIGDVNESNILVTDTALITVVDTDSFQVRDPEGEMIFHCPVGKPEFTPAELQGKVFHYVERTPAHDRFGLAVLIFQLLMEGTHPFAGVYTGEGEPPPYEARIAAGHFPYGTKEVPYRPNPVAPPLSILPANILQLFLRCFQDGHTDPQARPDAETWVMALREAEHNLTACFVNNQHRYGKHLPECPWCRRAAFLGGRDPFPSVERVQSGQHLQPLEIPVQSPLPAASIAPAAPVDLSPPSAAFPAARAAGPPVLSESTGPSPIPREPEMPPAPRINVSPRPVPPSAPTRNRAWIIPALLILLGGAVAIPFALRRSASPAVIPGAAAVAPVTAPPAPPLPEIPFAKAQDPVTKGDVASLSGLLAQDPQLAKKQGKDRWTLLHFAAYSGRTDVAQLLLEKGADANAKEKDGFTPLHLAAQEGKVEVARLLIEKGADPNVQESLGWTPLHFAAQEGRLDVAKLLLENGADPNIKEKKGLTPMAVAQKEHKTAVADYLRQNGGQP